jgi:hypothetical protein
MKWSDAHATGMNLYIRRLWISSVLVSIILLITSECYSFDVDGFQSGMTSKTIVGILNEQSFYEVSRKGNDIHAYDIRANRTVRSYNFSFCRGKLVLLQKNFEASMSQLIALIDLFLKRYGDSVQVNTEISDASYGKHHAMHFLWKKRSEMFSIHYHVFPKNDQLFLVYEVENNCYQVPYFK